MILCFAGWGAGVVGGVGVRFLRMKIVWCFRKSEKVLDRKELDVQRRGCNRCQSQC